MAKSCKGCANDNLTGDARQFASMVVCQDCCRAWQDGKGPDYYVPEDK